jgi:lysyl-tRNA synthetase class 2
MNTSWQPTASLQNLYLRARLYQDIRHFFATRQVLEVETPILSAGCLPDHTITSFATDYHGNYPKRLFLHTSPEFPMKRLLAAYPIPIYQITKVFRDGEAGRRHNPEFTMLEWYRPSFTQDDLINEVDELLQTVLHCLSTQRISYCDLFEQSVQLHPLQTPLSTLQHYASKFNIDSVEQLDRDTCLQLIMSCDIEPQLGNARPLVVTDFPASQAALARKNPENPQLAERFEVYFQGIELANGFYELTDPVEQRQRFAQDLEKRHTLALPAVPLDERFLAALEAGLPNCAGVAVGLDRLLMIMANASHIHEVMAFPIDLA